MLFFKIFLFYILHKIGINGYINVVYDIYFDTCNICEINVMFVKYKIIFLHFWVVD